jgi:hypothetical protein
MVVLVWPISQARRKMYYRDTRLLSTERLTTAKPMDGPSDG